MTAHTHDPQAVEKVAEAIAHEHMQTTPYYIAWSRLDERGKKHYRKLAVAALDAVETLYETEAGE